MKKTRNVALISSFLIIALINLIIFLTIPEARLDSAVFWLAWSFAIPVNFAAICALTVFGTAKGGVEVVNLPIAAWLSIGFGGAYLISGLIMMYLPVEKTTFPIILIAAISVFYIIAVVYGTVGAGYIASAQKETKQKVMYIKLLEADINDAMSKATNQASVTALSTLAENVRFSDPMSHPSLASLESQISFTVSEINASLTEAPDADVTSLAAKCQSQLDSRNSRCLLLK